MNDDRLDEALRALPPAGASTGFTDGVVARVARRGRRRQRGLAASLVLGAGLAALVFVALRSGTAPSHRDPGVAGEIEALRREQRALAAELASVRALDHEAPPDRRVIYLGRSAGVDLVLDVARLQQPPRPGAGGRAP
jgi:hypothetical protein